VLRGIKSAPVGNTLLAPCACPADQGIRAPIPPRFGHG